MSTTLERLKQLFIAKFDSNIEELKPTTTLEYLGLDSLDMVDFLFDIENEFKIKIPDQEFSSVVKWRPDKSPPFHIIYASKPL